MASQLQIHSFCLLCDNGVVLFKYFSFASQWEVKLGLWEPWSDIRGGGGFPSCFWCGFIARLLENMLSVAFNVRQQRCSQDPQTLQHLQPSLAHCSLHSLLSSAHIYTCQRSHQAAVWGADHPIFIPHSPGYAQSILGL